MTTLRLAVLAGCLIGLGVSLIIWRLVPAQIHLGDALERLSPSRLSDPATQPIQAGSLQDRLGIWAQRHLPVVSYIKVPTHELALLRIPVHRYLGEKALYALIGLLFPTVATVVFGVLGLHLPIVFPVLGSLLLAIGLSFLPDITARTQAGAAREEFARALGAYIDLVALERHAGSGATQSLEKAAEIGDSWVFRRLREELHRAGLAGTPPWDGLTELAAELGLPELADLGDIMRLSGEEGATVYDTLRARSAGLRTALLAREHEKANAAGERMTMPVSALALIFLALLAAPAILRIVGSTR